MNFKLVCIEVFAMLAAYLVFSLSFASATNVKIYYNGAYQSSAQYTPQNSISKSVTIDSGSVIINVTNATADVSVEKVYVYKCRGLTPGACISGIPEASNGTFGGVYPWSSVSDGTGGYPQKANFLILAKVISSGKAFWTGFWQTVERSDASTYTPYESQIGEMQVHAKTIDNVAQIRSFIIGNRMIPFNPQWVAKVVFPAANGIYLIKAGLDGIEGPQLTANESSQNQLTGIDQDYVFALLNTSDALFSPVTLRLNPNYNCGNGNCESGLGETQANCCLDCACQAGYYCDINSGCRQTSGISLSLFGTPQTAVTNCNQQHTLNISVRINNPPSGTGITSTRYRLGSSPEQASSCAGGSQTGYVFACPVVVPAVANCDAGSYNVGPNYINFSITYANGSSTASKYIAASFPNIAIGSYECGNHNCESSLGESPSLCCYDCGCASGYCDLVSPPDGSCRTDPANSNLQVSGVAPPGFYTHSPGDSVTFLAQVTNSPATLSVTGQACSLGCARSDGQACSAGCSASCSDVGFGSGTYNSSCAMSFTIPAYDSLKGYSLFPVMNLSVSYSNGSLGTVQKILSSSFSTINIGGHWCGDKKCDPDETSGTCCYDCGCAAGYCDTQNIQYRSEGDSCRENPQIEIDHITSASFSDTYEQHSINITGHTDTKPSGISLVPSCTFGSANSGVPCYVTCEAVNGSQAYSILCRVIVPSMDYNSSSFFNPATKRILLGQNSLNIGYSYNNGSSRANQESSFEIPDIVINVVPKCGNRACEKEAGESKATCCPDCSCGSGYFCYTGKSLNGECLPNSAISMRIREVQPNPVNCTIFELGKKCAFTESAKAYLEVMNPPSDLEMLSSYYRILYAGKYTNYTVISCYRVESQEGNYSCAFSLEPDAGKISPGTEDHMLELKMSFSYTSNGALKVLNASDTFSFSVNRVYSEAVASCARQQESMDKKIKALESDKTLYTVLAAVFFLLSAFFWVIYIACHAKGVTAATCAPYKTYAIIAGIVGGCGLAFVLNRLSSIDSQIRQLQAQKQSLCAASSFGVLSSAASSSGSMIYTIGQLYGGATCAMGVIGAVGGLSFGAASTVAQTSSYTVIAVDSSTGAVSSVTLSGTAGNFITYAGASAAQIAASSGYTIIPNAVAIIGPSTAAGATALSSTSLVGLILPAAISTVSKISEKSN
jgi:hypothetical protein